MAAAANDYIFVHTTTGLLSRYKVEANGTLTDQGDLTLPVVANDTAAFAGRGLLYVALGQQGVDPLLQVQVYAVDFETSGLTLLQTLNVAEEPSRIVVTDAGNADVIYMASEETLLLTAYMLNADGTIGAQIDQRDLNVDIAFAPGSLIDLDVTADGRHLYVTTQKWISHYETNQDGTLIPSSFTFSPEGGLRDYYSLDIAASTGKVWTTAKVSGSYRVDVYSTSNGVPSLLNFFCCRTSINQPVTIQVRNSLAYVPVPLTNEIDTYEDNTATIVYMASEFADGNPIVITIHPTDDNLWVGNHLPDEMVSYGIQGDGLLSFLQRIPGAAEPVGMTLVGVPLIDCNSNGLHDPTEILGGLADCNANAIPDQCEGPNCPGIVAGDMDCSGTVTLADLADFVDALLAGTFTCNADTNNDQSVNGLDAAAFVTLLLP